jgi:hypothetical protein
MKQFQSFCYALASISITIGCNSSSESNDNINKIQKEAIRLYAEAKTGAFTKGIITKDKMRESDSLWTKFLIRNPDSALEYAKNINLLVITGSLEKWPSLNKTVNQSFIDSQSKVAFGSIRFGMTSKEYNNLPYDDRKNVQLVGDYEYFLNPNFDNNDRLYLLIIESGKRDANYIETELRNKAFNLGNVISKKYLDYEVFTHKYPSIISLDPGKVTYFEKWEVGDKKINLGLAEVSTGSLYYNYCEIYSDSLFTNHKNIQNRNSEAKQVTDADKF